MNISLYKKKYILFIALSLFLTCQYVQAVVNFTGTLAGDVTGTQKATAVSLVGGLGGVTKAQIISGVRAANAATNANTASTIVKRDVSGNFSAGTITASLNGNASTATSVSNFSGSLAGDVTGSQSATVVGHVGGVTAANVANGANAANAATSANTASKIVIRDGSGNFSTHKITLDELDPLTTNTIRLSGNLSLPSDAKLLLNEIDLLTTQTLFIDGNVALGENASFFVDFISGASGSLVNTIVVNNLGSVNNFTPSDKCLKTDITDLDSELCLDLVNQMNPREFDYIPAVKKALGDDGKRHVGFIAQELAKVDPRFVSFMSGSKMFGDLTTEELAVVKQELFVPLLVGALKAEDKKLLDQLAQTEQLQARVKVLEEYIASMKRV